MCNELQVAAFQISRAETDLTPGPCFSCSSIQVARHRRITMRKAQRLPLQRGVHGWRRAKRAGATDPPDTLWVIIVPIWYRLGEKLSGMGGH